MKTRLLVIDDEDHIRRVMRMTLEAAGYEVGEAADGARGLEAFGDGSTWDAVLLDQRMPGMDGLETLRRMKERKADARVIMITAYASIELAVDAMKLGATDFVRKPMTPEIVRNAVTAALAKPAAAPPAATAAARKGSRTSNRPYRTADPERLSPVAGTGPRRHATAGPFEASFRCPASRWTAARRHRRNCS